MENTENDAKFIEINPLSKEFFTREFQKKNFFFNADKPSLIGSAQNERFQKSYIAFRSLYVVYYCARLIFLVTYRGKLLFHLYFISWSVITEFLTHILHLICSIRLYMDLNKHQAETSTLYKVTWLMFTLSFNISSLSVIFAAEEFCVEPDYIRGSQFFGNGAPWAGNIIYFINIFVSGVPVRLFHFYPGVIFGLAFATLVTVHWAVTGQVTCNTLYGYQQGTVFAILVGVYTSLFVYVQINFFIIYWMRLLMYKYLCCCCFEVQDDEIAGTNIDAEENVAPTAQEVVV